jgi:hypothetical protein
VIGIIVGVFLLLRRRRKAAGGAAYGEAKAPAGYQAPGAHVASEAGYSQSHPGSDGVYQQVPVGGDAGAGYYKPQTYTDQHVTHELPARQEPQELQ